MIIVKRDTIIKVGIINILIVVEEEIVIIREETIAIDLDIIKEAAIIGSFIMGDIVIMVEITIIVIVEEGIPIIKEEITTIDLDTIKEALVIYGYC